MAKVFARGLHVAQLQIFCNGVALSELMFPWEWFLYGPGVEISHACLGQARKRNDWRGQWEAMVEPRPVSRSLILFFKGKVRNFFSFKSEHFQFLNANANYLKILCRRRESLQVYINPQVALVACQTGPGSTVTVTVPLLGC